MRKLLYTLLLFAAVLSGCKKDNKGEGHVQLRLTDAPVDGSNVTGVFITVTGIEYHHQGKWKLYEGFDGPKVINLLDFNSGKVADLGIFPVEAGKYNQIRFMLDIDEENKNAPNPGCYILFSDSTRQSLYVPSGGQTGYKAVGNFQVPVNGSVVITADFDVRKAVVLTGSGKYILKPTIRLIVEDQAGHIKGTISNNTSFENLVVYAYKAGTYSSSEADAPAPGESRFPNAETSAKADASGNFTLAFLAPGAYDLVVVNQTASGDFIEVVKVYSGVHVQSRENTSINIAPDSL